jgi:uncharacterized protein YdeI (YjbR/CyaY-like superfamily)
MSPDVQPSFRLRRRGARLILRLLDAMQQPTPKTFSVVLEATEMWPTWAIARIPIDLKKCWPAWTSRRVRGEINGFAFSTSLFPVKRGNRLALLVNKQMQKGGGVRVGSKVKIRLEPDLEKHGAAVPLELANALKVDRRLRRWFDSLSPSMRRGIGMYVDQAKSTETRKIRGEGMAESLMLAMDGEEETPPILRAAFQRQPLARDGWDAMTPKQRRNHLLGIFYVQTVHGREKRAARAVEEALQVARRKAGKTRDLPADLE